MRLSCEDHLQDMEIGLSYAQAQNRPIPTYGIGWFIGISV